MRLVPFLALAILALPAVADSPSIKPSKQTEQEAPKGQEAGTYRFGATYSLLAGETASACQKSCSDDGACVAWSFVSSYDGTDARCELKRGGGHSRPDPLATSGISPRHEALYATEQKPEELDGAPDPF